MEKILWLPARAGEKLVLPSYVKLDMAFGLGTGTKLGDKSRYRSHGTISGATWATGAHGYALDFNSATPDYVEIAASHTQLDFTSEDFSIVFRGYIDSLASSRYIFSRGNYKTDGFDWLVHLNGYGQFQTHQSGAIQYSTTAVGAITAGAWYTMGISRTGSSVILYLNGVASSAVVGTHVDPATCSRTAKIGIANNKVTNPYDGKVEFLRIFGGIALSASEQLAWHNALA